MAMRTAMVGTRAPAFSLLCTDGTGSARRQVSLDDYLDRWLMLLFYSRDFSLLCTEGARCGAKQVSLDDYLDRWLLLLFYSRDFSLV